MTKVDNQLPLFEGQQPDYQEITISGKVTQRELARPHPRHHDSYYVIKVRTGPITHGDDKDGVMVRRESSKVLAAYELPENEGFEWIEKMRSEEQRRLDEILGRNKLFGDEVPKTLTLEEVGEIQERMNAAGIEITLGLNDDGILIDTATAEPAISALPYIKDPNETDDPEGPELAAWTKAIGEPDIVKALEANGVDGPTITIAANGDITWLQPEGPVNLVLRPPTGDDDPEAIVSVYRADTGEHVTDIFREDVDE